jgi:hypothetical protein
LEVPVVNRLSVADVVVRVLSGLTEARVLWLLYTRAPRAKQTEASTRMVTFM